MVVIIHLVRENNSAISQHLCCVEEYSIDLTILAFFFSLTSVVVVSFFVSEVHYSV